MSPRDATIKAMDEVAGPVIAVGLVLSAVFVPCVFISGIVGEFYRQFAVTIAVSTLISAFNSLTLSPALCALLLKPHGDGRGAASRCRGWRSRSLGAAAGVLVPRRARRPRSALPASGRRGWPRLVAVPVVAGLAGGLVGCAAAGRAEPRPRLAVRRVQRAGSTPSPTATCGSSAVALRGSACSCSLGYGGLLYLTYHTHHHHADRVHPAAGQGLPAGERAAAGRGVARPHGRRRCGSWRTIARGTPGVKHTVSGVRAVGAARRERPELRHAVRHARRLPEPPRPGPARPTRSRRSCRAASTSRCRGRW